MRLNSPGFGTPAATWCGDFASSGWSLLAAEDMEVTGKKKIWPKNMAAVVFFFTFAQVQSTIFSPGPDGVPLQR